MRESSDMTSGTWVLHRLRRTTTRRVSIHWVAMLLALVWLTSTSSLADGCFVFKWNKSIDINEPTQKAIIVYDAGREDMLLQVKYEGPLEEFGWLIPVPSLPTVEKGSMEPFYELSQLTQRHFGTTKGMAVMSASLEGRGEEKVKVIEVKTVGAYEVAVLSAKDAGSLTRWLQNHDYSLPEGKSDIVDDYISRDWYFIAAKIDLKKGVGFKAVTGGSPKDSQANTRKAIKSKLSSGELHPLLISFDTPECIFPLRISGVGGKPSEVSLYVISTEPLLNPFIFGKASAKLEVSYANWEAQKPQNAKARQASTQNLRTLQLAWQMYALDRTNHTANPNPKPEWKREDLEAMAAEGMPPTALEPLDDRFYAAPEELLQCLRVTPDKIPKSAGGLVRLKNRNWYLTKQVWTFSPSEMNDLQFVPAIPALAKLLNLPIGIVAAQVIVQLGSNAVPSLIAACQGTNPVERVNALRGLEQLRDQRLVVPLLDLLRDESPLVRYHAVQAAEVNWDTDFIEPVQKLLRDPHKEIAGMASICLYNHEGPDRTPVYLALVNDPSPSVRMSALTIAMRINRFKPLPELINAALALLKDPNEEVQNYALNELWRVYDVAIPRSDLIPLLRSSRSDTIMLALRLIEGTGRVQPALSGPVASAREAALRARRISSNELAVLATNRLGEMRFMSLQLLERNGDAKAVELTLPLLRDTNSVVRSRAFSAMRNLSGRDISETDPDKWDQWWAANKDTFKPKL
jgi:HEAT repeat protein